MKTIRVVLQAAKEAAADATNAMILPAAVAEGAMFSDTRIVPKEDAVLLALIGRSDYQKMMSDQ